MYDRSLANFVDADLGSVESSAARHIDGTMPEQRAHRAGSVATEMRFKRTGFAIL